MPVRRCRPGPIQDLLGLRDQSLGVAPKPLLRLAIGCGKPDRPTSAAMANRGCHENEAQDP
jgi:hypothetical protein